MQAAQQRDALLATPQSLCVKEQAAVLENATQHRGQLLFSRDSCPGVQLRHGRVQLDGERFRRANLAEVLNRFTQVRPRLIRGLPNLQQFRRRKLRQRAAQISRETDVLSPIDQQCQGVVNVANLDGIEQ